jgi:hypothetical protein
VGACLLNTTRRENDRGSVLRSQLTRHADSRFRDFQVDVDQRDIGPLAARQLQCLCRCVRGPEHRVARILEHRNGTVSDDYLILDD